MYIVYQGRQMMSVKCKGACPKILVQRRGPAQNLRLDRTSEYGELVIEMRETNGLTSKHETAMCRDCRERLRALGGTYDELKAIYDEDLAQWLYSALHAGTPKADAERMLARFAGRIPLRALQERGRGETFI